MAISLSLRPNVLDDGKSHCVRVVSPNRVTFEALLDDMAKDTALSQDDMRVAIQRFRTALCERLTLGYRVETPIGSFNPGIRAGVVRRDTTSVDRCRLRVNYVPDRGLLHEFQDRAAVTMVEFRGYKQPQIDLVWPARDDTTEFHAGAVCKVRGSRLRFDRTLPDLGLFLLPVQPSGDTPTPSAHREIRVSQYSRNGSRFIDFLIPPETPAGTYRLDLRTRTRAGVSRRCLYHDVIRVEAPRV